MKHILGLMLLMYGLNISAKAQYKQALGIQFPFDISACYSQFVTENNTVDIYGGVSQTYYALAGYYTFHFNGFEKSPQMNWFVGPGIRGVWNKLIMGKNESAGLGFGLSGILGLQYCFEKIPLCAGINSQPGITLVGKPAVQSSTGGLTLHYILKR